jgi:hypothetical protein
VCAEDVARVAATLLANPGVPSRRAYELIGVVPTVNEIVETLGRALPRPIRYVQITDEQWVEAVKDGLNLHALDHLSHLWQYFRSGIPNREKGYHIQMSSVCSPARMSESIHAQWVAYVLPDFLSSFTVCESPVSAANLLWA